MEAARRALDRSRPGDLVVLCVDYATDVYRELEKRSGVAAPDVLGSRDEGQVDAAGGDPDLIDLAPR
jgi:cyanophycin synthetase